MNDMHTFERLEDLDFADQRDLLSIGRERLLGAIIRLNQAKRYYRRLNVFVLLADLLDREAAPVRTKPMFWNLSDSSPRYPGSSENPGNEHTGGPIFGRSQD